LRVPRDHKDLEVSLVSLVMKVREVLAATKETAAMREHQERQDLEVAASHFMMTAMKMVGMTGSRSL
jgi:hypothetical protein